MIIDSHEHVILPTERQIQIMDEAGIDKTILFSTTPHVEKAEDLEGMYREMKSLYDILGGSTSTLKRINNMKKCMNELINVIDKNKERFIGFGNVPLGLDINQTEEWIENYIINNNFKGLGEFTPGNMKAAEQLEIVFKCASNYNNLPLWIHTFNPVDSKSLHVIFNLCEAYSNVNIIFGHHGGSNWMEAIEFAKNHKNVYLDFSAAFSTIPLKIAIKEMPERCLFSSDAPYGEPVLYRNMIEYVEKSQEVRNMILGDNIRKLLNI